MQYESIELTYLSAAGDGAVHSLLMPLGSLKPNVAQSQRDAWLELSVVVDEAGVVEVSATPFETVFLKTCVMHLHHMFAGDETLLLNGYQSWTDTHPLATHAKMRGLMGVPKKVIERYALDGSGDYRFVDYDNKPGHLHGFTYATIASPEGARPSYLVASLDESHGFTLIRFNTVDAAIDIEPECPMKVLDPHEPRVLCRVAVLDSSRLAPQGTRAAHEREQEALYDAWFALANVHARPVRPLVGYTSWYRHYGDINQDKLMADLDGAQAALSDLDSLGVLPVFQIDDGYCKVGDWLDVSEERFPDGMARMAQAIRDRGLLPGLWMAPFVCERDSKLFAQHPDWLLRDQEGNLCPTGSHWSGGFALDITNEQVCEYVSRVVRTAVEAWGFGMLKLDFLYGACMIAHAGLNRGELMSRGVELLREAAGERCLLLGCGVPLGSVFGAFDFCRIGCDVGLNWDGNFVMRRLHRERVSTRNSLANTIGRAPLDGRAFGCDPDVFFLRNDVRLTQAQRERLISSAACYASMLLTSDNMGDWDQEQHALFEAAVEVLAQRKCR